MSLCAAFLGNFGVNTQKLSFIYELRKVSNWAVSCASFPIDWPTSKLGSTQLTGGAPVEMDTPAAPLEHAWLP